MANVMMYLVVIFVALTYKFLTKEMFRKSQKEIVLVSSSPNSEEYVNPSVSFIVKDNS